MARHRMIAAWVVSACALLAFMLAGAPTVHAAQDPAFRAFLNGLKPEARARGVSEATFERWLGGLEPDRTLPDLILPGQTRAQGKQAEFTKTPLEYLDLPMLERLAGQGKRLAQQHAATLAQIEKEIGVDRHVLLAIWGRETAFGTYRLPHNMLRVLATQAYLGRRKETFRSELLIALKLIQDGQLDPNTRASWAGAVGLTQFLPSEFETLAIDMDRDGKKDIWNSIPDALASAANQLKAKGWIGGQPWGYEVKLPQGGTCLYEGQPNARPARDWIAAGVVRSDGRKVPDKLLDAPAFILTPGGAYGPVFLVFENFMVLKRYNFADLYAVFVGHLADRMGGGGNFATAWTTPKIISTKEIEEIQERLKARGLPIEKIDGKAGMNTRNLIGQYQKGSGIAIDCWPGADVLSHLRRQASR